MQVLQDANLAQRNVNPSPSEIAELHANIATLKKDLAIRPDNCALKDDIFTLRAQQSTIGVDITYLKARAHAVANDLQGLLGVPETGLLGSLETLKNQAFERDLQVRALHEDGQAIRNDFGRFRSEFAGVQSDLDLLQENIGRVDAAAKQVVRELEGEWLRSFIASFLSSSYMSLFLSPRSSVVPSSHFLWTSASVFNPLIPGTSSELKAAQATTDQDLGARIREEVKAELQTLKEQAEEARRPLLPSTSHC